VFESRMPCRKLGSNTEKIVGSWRKLHNKELHNLYGYY
jgi:hypothetical protein